MGWILLILFTAVPITEMYLLITVGGYIGTLPTIACVMLTAVIGVTLLRWQGMETLQRGVGKLGQGQLPAKEIAEGMMLAVAGALLLTPGFVTDTVGFLLLMPPVRALLAHYAAKHIKVANMAGVTPPPSTASATSSSTPRQASRDDKMDGRDPVVIEGEYERKP